MGNFANRNMPQKPKTMNVPLTLKTFKRRDGSEGSAGYLTFSDGNKKYAIQITTGDTGKTTRNGRQIVGWASIAQFLDNGNNSGFNAGW